MTNTTENNYNCYMCDTEFSKEGTWHKHNPTPLYLCLECQIRLFVRHDAGYLKEFQQKVMNDDSIC
jgi:predicted SprT family Zn-dependent metalloprotease